ncbi:MAG TPA: response regulator [Methylomirabilota bacterium]|nr:response regulator [Methylomirabilota bacterium]
MSDSGVLILNVDDYEGTRYARTRLLQRAGFEVREAGTGMDALRLAAELRPSVILLDVNLPDIDGFEVCRRLRAESVTMTVPIVHLSATFVSEKAQTLAYEGGADSYLTDPVEPAVLLATIRSLLRLRRAEEGLREVSRAWTVTFDAIGDGIGLLDTRATVVRGNAAFAALVGVPPDDLAGLPWAEIWRRLGGSDSSFITDSLQSRRRETVDLERDGAWLRLQVDPVVEGERVTGLVCILSDVTMERQAAEVRAALFAREQKAREEAEASNRAKDEFLAMLGHELRNPLDVIASAVRVVEAQADDESLARRAHEAIGRQVRQLGRLVDDLLDVGRVTTGKISLTRTSVDLAETTQRCVAGLRPEGETPRHRVTVDAEPTWVTADQARVEQIIMNLLSNAVKYTPAGGDIAVTVKGDGKMARLSVRDTGVGMTPYMLERVFDLFFQGERTLDRAEGGLGIGLTLVRRLVELHGGRVSAESPGPGLGSTITVELPETVPPREAAPAAAAAGPTPRRILIVEDSRDSRDMLRILLERAGHEVHEAADGPSGVEAILRVQPDIALVDVGLPGLDGYALARQVRARAGRRPMRLVALTGYGTPDDHRRSREAGFDAHLVKPVDPARLAAVIADTGPR